MYTVTILRNAILFSTSEHTDLDSAASAAADLPAAYSTYTYVAEIRDPDDRMIVSVDTRGAWVASRSSSILDSLQRAGLRLTHRADDNLSPQTAQEGTHMTTTTPVRICAHMDLDAKGKPKPRTKCSEKTIGKSKYCRTHRALARERFPALVAQWKADAAARKERATNPVALVEAITAQEPATPAQRTARKATTKTTHGRRTAKAA